MAARKNQTPLNEAGIEMSWRREPVSLLGIDDRARVWDQGHILTLQRRDVLFAANDRADTLYYVRSGRLKLEMGGPGGDDTIIVGMRSACGLAGYRSIIAGERHSATATALEPTSLIGIPRKLALDIFDRNQKMANYVVRLMARQVKASNHRLWAMTHKQLRGRLADTLLLLRDTFGYAAATRDIDIELTREELAQMSNMNTANAIRTLSSFTAEGFVKPNGRKITIIDEDTLRKTSETG